MLKTLRATPHAVSLAAHDDSQARVWYGRMILPPKDAYSPGTDATYGDVRNRLIDTPDAEVPSGFGCSSVGMRALSGGGRKKSCEANELLCWTRCMPLADFNINENTCADQGLRLQCMNPHDQFSDGSNHGLYYPACSKSTTPYRASRTGQPDADARADADADADAEDNTVSSASRIQCVFLSAFIALSSIVYSFFN
jgi:hypothetical protein